MTLVFDRTITEVIQIATSEGTILWVASEDDNNTDDADDN